MNPEPIFLDFILDTPIKAEDLRKRDVTVILDRDYQFRRPDCVDIYREFCLQVEQLRELLTTHYRDYKTPMDLIDLLDTKVLATEVTGLTFCVTHVEGKYSASTTLHDHTVETLLKTRLEQREDLYELLKKDTNTRSEVRFYLTEVEKIDRSILHLHQQNSILQLSKL